MELTFKTGLQLFCLIMNRVLKTENVSLIPNKIF